MRYGKTDVEQLLTVQDVNVKTELDKITDNEGDIATNTANIATNTTNIASNTGKIEKNQDNIMVNAFRLQVQNSLSVLSYVDGVSDEYEDETGVDTNNSSNQAYNSSGDYYEPLSTGIDENTKLLLHGEATSGVRNPYAHFKCNETSGTTVTDSGQGSNNGTANVNTSLLTVSGKVNNAFEFDGTEAINIPALRNDITSDTRGSISLWVKTTNAGAVLFSLGGSSGTNSWIELMISACKARFWGANDPAVYFIDVKSTTSVNTGEWVHIVVTQDGFEPNIYINGVEETLVWVNTTNRGAWMSASLADDDGRLACRVNSNGDNEGLLSGQLDDVRYYKHALSQAEVTWLYNSGNGREDSGIDDDSGQNHLVKSFGTAQLFSPKIGNGCADFRANGYDDYITVPHSTDWDFGSGDFTIEFWANWHSTNASQYWMIGQWGSSDNAWYCQSFSFNNPRFHWSTNGSNDVNTGATFGTWIPVPYRWYHIAYVRNGSDLKLYIDGKQQGSTYNIGSTTIYDSGQAVNIAGHSTYGAYTDWNIDELRISKGVARYTTEFTPSTTAFTSDSNTKLLLHFESDFTDSGNTGHTVTVQNGASIMTKKFSEALYFDGDSDYLTIADSTDWDICGSNSDDWTIDFWTRFQTTTGNQFLISQWEDSSNFWYFRHRNNGDSFDGLEFTVGMAGDTSLSMTGMEITDNDWHHVALIKVADKYGLYIDGTQTAYDQSSSTDTFTGSLYLGRRGDNNGYFNGFMDEIRIQHSNPFNASPNSGKTDTISVPTSEYSASKANMTLISDSVSAESEPDSARIILLEEDVDSITLNTDIKAYVSKDGGSTWVQGTLSDAGNYDSSKQILVADFDLTASGVGSGTDMEYKLETVNNKNLRLHATGLSWD